MEKLVAIVPAAGAGKRLGLGINKAFAILRGAPLLVHCLQMLARTELVAEAIVVLAPHEVDEGQSLLAGYREEYFPSLPIKVVAGGKERQQQEGRQNMQNKSLHHMYFLSVASTS